MANDLSAATDPALGHRELISLARSPSHWTHNAASALLGDAPAATLLAAFDVLEYEMSPVPVDLEGRRNWMIAIGERLKKIAAKVAPHLSIEQGDAWRDAVADALSDLPARVVLTAAKRAIHRPFRFMSEIEGAVREIADELVAERERAAVRLRWLQEGISRALPAPADDAEPAVLDPIPADEIRRMTPELRRMGIGCGALTQDQIDEALAERRQEPEASTPVLDKIIGTPTVADYVAHGLTEAEAAQAVRDHARILARGAGGGMRAATAAALAPIEEAIAAE